MAGKIKKTKKPGETSRTNTLRIRLTEKERSTLDATAATRTLDTSTWARMILLDVAAKAPSKIDPT